MNGNQTGGAGSGDYAEIQYKVEAQDIADQIMYLTSDAGKHISGQAISIDCDTKMLL